MSVRAAHPEAWLTVEPAGLACRPGGFVIDPVRPVPVAVVTHGHADHARPGLDRVYATPETLAIMAARLGADAPRDPRPLPPGAVVALGETRLSLRPAGHVLGSAQAVIEHGGWRVVVSGDYKRRPDPTCAPFEPIACDVFVTEATFGLPVFRHPPDGDEIARLLRSVAAQPERTHVVGCYALGKAQRLLALLARAGWDRPVPIHGALAPVTELYRRHGVALPPTEAATAADKARLAGAIVLAPPSAIADRWARRLTDPVVGLASGWMRVKQRAKQRGVELPLVISDHADWDELSATIDDVQAPELWVTHGREEALVRAAALKGVRARALALIGREEEGQ